MIIDKIIAFKVENNSHLSSEYLKTLEDRLISKILGKKSYSIPYEGQSASEEDILNWFVASKHGPKLHRRAIVMKDRDVETFLRSVAHVDVNQPDKKTGDTPLILAARAHDADTVKALLDADATINARNKLGKDSIYEAITELNQQCYRDQAQYKTIKHLLDHGADINQSLLGNPKVTLSESTILKAEVRIANEILRHTKNIHPRMIFELARGKNQDSSIIINRILRSRHFDLDTRNSEGLTALMIATIHNKQRVMRALINRPDNAIESTVIRPVYGFDKHMTAYSLSLKNGDSCSKTLLDYGAKKIVPTLTDEEAEFLKKDKMLAKRRNEYLKDSTLGIAFFP